MNFKFTKTKIITSLIISIVIGIIGGFFALCFSEIQATCTTLRVEAGIIYFIISLIVIYLIWSLIQKKK